MALNLPSVGGSEGVWGDLLNDALNNLDGRVTTAQSTAGNANTTAQSAAGTANTNGQNITALTSRVTTAEADIDALQAGASGGSIKPTIIDARGDLIVGTADDTPARLAVGTDQQVVTADSTAPGGLTYRHWRRPNYTTAARPTAATLGLGGGYHDTTTGLTHDVVSIGGTPTYTPPPGAIVAKLRQTTAQTIAGDSVGYSLTWHVADYDRLTGWSAATNPTRWTAPTPGWYELNGGASLAAHATGGRVLFWYVNGAVVVAGGVYLPNNGTSIWAAAARTIPVYLNATDYVELRVLNTSGASLATNVINTQYAPYMTVAFMGAA